MDEVMLVCCGYLGVHYCKYGDNPQPINNFYTDIYSYTGVHRLCKKCMGESNRRWRKQHNPKSNAISAKSQELARADGIPYLYADGITRDDRKRWGYRKMARSIVGENIAIASIKEDLPKIHKDSKTKSISVPRETYPREGYVYIFQDRMKPNGVYKIGSTDDVGGRLSNARTWGEFQCVRWFYSGDCKMLEKNTHNELSEFRINKDDMGDEWFRIAKATAISKIQELSNAATTV